MPAGSFDCFSTQVLASHLSAEQRRKLAAEQVGIAGAGGLGSNCALMLARSGIAKMVIVDHDVVSLSNLNRQAYWARHVGLPKVKALAAILHELNPEIKLTLYQEKLNAASACRIFAECPILVEAVDDAQTKAMLAEHLTAEGHYVVSASGIAGWGGNSMQIRHFGTNLVIVGDFVNEADDRNPPLAPRVTMAAAMQADAVLCRILGKNSAGRTEHN